MRNKFVGLLVLGALSVVGFATATAKTGEAPLVGVIVHTSKPYKKVISQIEDLGGIVTIQYENADAIAAQVPADKFGDLVALRRVQQIEKDYMVEVPSSPEAGFEPRQLDLSTAGLELLDGDAVAERFGAVPENYYSYLSDVTGASDTWAATGFGADSITAVIDTGTDATHVCIAGRVIEGPNFSGDGISSISPLNHFHGTFVGGVIATGNGCALLDVVGGLFETHLPPEAEIPIGGPFVLIPLLGMAPASEIYAVKVFPATGAGVPSSIIEQALDHVISVKKSGALDIDVVNMSLGGATLNDGRSLEEMLVDAATDAGMTVVISAGNSGPAPNSVARPGTAFSALTVAAASDPVHTRIFWDLIFGPGQGLAMYPDDVTRPADFSSRGPYGDGRAGPDVIATGVFNFSLFPNFGIGWASGTSFSAPTVAGGAALLNAWAENNDPSMGPRAIRNAIMDGANALSGWSSLAQGNGYLNVADSLALLERGKVNNGLRHTHTGGLKPNVLLGRSDEVTQTVSLGPAETYDWVFKIDENTQRIEVDIDVIGGPIAPGPGAIPNSFEFYVKSAKKGGAPYIIDTANVFDDASAIIGDGFVSLSGGFAPVLDVEPNEWPMEPGLMKVTLESDWTNNAASLSAQVTIRRFQGAPGNNAGGVTTTIAQDEFDVFFVDIPSGEDTAIFDLSWQHDWSKFPTADLDMILFSPSFDPAFFFAGATLNSPERVVVDNPEAGIWIVIVDGFEVAQGRDPYVLEVTSE